MNDLIKLHYHDYDRERIVKQYFRRQLDCSPKVPKNMIMYRRILQEFFKYNPKYARIRLLGNGICIESLLYPNTSTSFACCEEVNKRFIRWYNWFNNKRNK